MPIVDTTALLGHAFVIQALIMDPLANPAGLIVSNALRGGVGWR